jgi:periplasmic protein TonB
MSDQTTLEALRPPPPKPIKKNRMPGIIFVIVLHVVMIYALASGLANSTIDLLRGDLETTVVAETADDDAPPPPPPPDFKPPPPSVPPPEVVIDLSTAPPPAQTQTITTTVDRPAAPPPVVAAAPPPPPPSPPVALARPPVGEADYPAISLRLQEQGVVELKYLISEGGQVQQTEIVKSSGSQRLDEAAQTLVKRKWKFKPATQDGKPVAAWGGPVRVVFQLK